MKQFAVIIFFAAFLFFCRLVEAQFPIKVPRLPKIEKPAAGAGTAEDARQRPPSDAGSRPEPAGKRPGDVVYGPVRRDATPRLIKDSVYVQAVTEREYWKAPGQTGFHSWAPKLRFNLFYNHERDLKFVAEYYNPDGTLWFSEPLTIGTAGNDHTNAVQSDRDNTAKIISTKASVATGMYGFKIKETVTGQTFFEGKFKVGKFLPPNRTKNQFEFFVDHDWEIPIGTVSFHFSNFANSGDNIGGFEPIVSMWFKGNYDDGDSGLEARLFFNGRQIATTANGGGVVDKDSSGGGRRATEQSIFAADQYHWQKWNFWWKNVRVDNGGTFNRANFPDAFYIDKNPGEYTVKVYRGGTQVRETNFTVAPDGRVVDGGYHKPGYLAYHTVIIPVKVIGNSEKYNLSAWKTEAFYANPMAGFRTERESALRRSMPKDHDLINLIVHQEGWFKGIDWLVKHGKITRDDASALKAYAYKRVGAKLNEVKQEIHKLQAVVGRIESLCRQGEIRRPFTGSEDSTTASLRQELKVLHGWTVSLAESDYFLLAAADSPGAAMQKFKDIEHSLLKLTLVRGLTLSEMPGKGGLFNL